MKENKFLNWVIKHAPIIALILILFSLVTPIIFTRPSVCPFFDFTETGQIGDTINGIMGPFIAIAAALLTFAAFYIQKEANDIQTGTINNQAKQDEIQKIESRLFSYIDLHRMNVSELRLERNFYFDQNGKLVEHENLEYFEGQDAIKAYRFTLYIILYLLKQQEELTDKFSTEQLQIFAYLILCYGKNLSSIMFEEELASLNDFTKEKKYINAIVDSISELISKEQDSSGGILNVIQKKLIEKNINLLIRIDCLHMNKLSRYFRQLFQIYKYIDKQTCLSDNQKYEYLKIVRSSLTNDEQELLYNDVLSQLGKAWEDEMYMTKYKPIKNIEGFPKIGYSPKQYYSKYENINVNEYVDISSYEDILS